MYTKKKTDDLRYANARDVRAIRLHLDNTVYWYTPVITYPTPM